MPRNQFSCFQTDVSLLLFRSKRVVRYQNVSKHANWYANKCISDRRVAGALLRRRHISYVGLRPTISVYRRRGLSLCHFLSFFDRSICHRHLNLLPATIITFERWWSRRTSIEKGLVVQHSWYIFKLKAWAGTFSAAFQWQIRAGEMVFWPWILGLVGVE